MSESGRFLVLRLAWRNLWRHKRRSWLTASAMAFCNALLIFMTCLQFGMYDMMILNTVQTFSGNAQIQHRNYLESSKMRYSVPGVKELAQRTRESQPGSRVSARAAAQVLISSERRSFGISLLGVQPDAEPAVSSIPGLVHEGRFLGDAGAAELILGETLARNLKVSLGDELTLLGSGLDGSFAAGVVELVGIFRTGIPDLDRSMAQIPLDYFQDTFAMEGHGHAVVVAVDDLAATESARAAAESLLEDEPELVAMDWDTLNPGVMQGVKSDLGGAWTIYTILIVLVAFSTLNTQLMSVMERTREFGVILSLGVRPGKLARLVMLETGLLAALGLALGLAIGGSVAVYLATYGFTFRELEAFAAEYNLTGRLYPKVSLLTMSLGPFIVTAFCLLASVYPAMRLYRFEPVEAMRAA